MSSYQQDPNPTAIAWAAGLFEGEGSIAGHGAGVRLQVKMTDEDVVRRFCSIVGGRVHGPYQYQHSDGHQRKAYWIWVSTSTDDMRAILRSFAPWLGVRRTERARRAGLLGQETLFNVARETPGKPR